MADFLVLGLSLPSYVGYFLCLIAIFSILGRLLPVLRFMRVLLGSKPKKGRYGLGSWAVVTGAASELGSEFCMQLAKDGYNLVLIARREPELRQTASTIEETYKVQTKVVVWSATDHGSNLEAYYSALISQMEDLDVSILVNLLSITEDGLYSKQPVELLVKTLDLNIWPSLILSRWAIGKMSKRKNRSAIINFSSMAAMYPYAGMSLHSATMKFIDFLSQSLHNELRLFPDIPLDLLTVQPSGIQSRTSAPAPNQVPPSLCVSAALKNLGRSPYTAGAFKHSFLNAFTSFIPESFKASLIVQRLKKSSVAVAKSRSS
jgi:17beta-estradiol 17-dehydrogenase / very-long-chain 3-oxoacyl-CoA reductase